MKAVVKVARQEGAVEVLDVDEPEITPSEVLVFGPGVIGLGAPRSASVRPLAFATPIYKASISSRSGYSGVFAPGWVKSAGTALIREQTKRSVYRQRFGRAIEVA